TDRLGGDRRGAQSLGDALELLYGKNVEAALLAFGDHQTLRQLLAVLRRQEQPSLVIETRMMCAEEHRPHLPRPVECSALKPLPSTAHHHTPLLPTVNRFHACNTANQEVFLQVNEGEPSGAGRWGAARPWACRRRRARDRTGACGAGGGRVEGCGGGSGGK